MIYFDNAATTFPKPPDFFKDMEAFMRERGGNPGRSGHRLATGAEAGMEEARNALSKFLGVKDPARCVFTLNTTDALNIALKGLLREGDHAITSVLEHNSVSRPLQKLNDDHVLSLTRIGATAEGNWSVDEVLAALTPKTRLVALTHASNVLGVLCPVEELCRTLRAKRPEVFIVIDAAQTAGVVPIDVDALGVDFLCCAGHKGLFGPTGTGALLIGARVKPTDVLAWREGGTGGDSSSPHQPQEFPHFLEGGTPNSLGVAGLLSGIKFHRSLPTGKVLAHEQGLIQRLIEQLGSDSRFKLYGTLDLKKKVGALSITIKDRDTAETASILDQAFEICVRPGLHCAPYMHKALGTYPTGTLRLSPGYFNTLEEADTVVKALKEIAS